MHPRQTGVRVKLIGQDSNVFNLIGLTAKSYDEALRLITEYTEVE